MTLQSITMTGAALPGTASDTPPWPVRVIATAHQWVQRLDAAQRAGRLDQELERLRHIPAGLRRGRLHPPSRPWRPPCSSRWSPAATGEPR